MSLQNPLKPQTAMLDIKSGEHFYPMTVPSQVLMEDGTRLDAYLKNMNGMDLLWTNASPTSAFAAQTVSLDLSSYKGVIIKYRVSISNALISSSYADVGDNLSLFCVTTTTDTSWYVAVTRREANITTSGIVFGTGYNAGSGVAATSNTQHLIPLKIYGIK